MSARLRRFVRRLAGEQRGATIIEFAVVIPVFCTLVMGLGELAYQTWAQAILDGAVQKAARDSAIQGGAQATSTLDAKVWNMVKVIAGNATYSSTRKSYSSFSNIAPEPFTDSNGNGKRDPGECFSDINGNSTWDADPGISGQGGANDVTVYTFTLNYNRIFPIAKLVGWSKTATITSTTLLKNQPYASQSLSTPATVCT